MFSLNVCHLTILEAWGVITSVSHTTSSFLSEHLSFENPDHSLAIPAASKLYGTINKLQHTETSLGFSSTFNTSNNVVCGS